MADKDLKQLQGQLGQAKSLALKKIEKLTEGSEWNLLQMIAQEIEADSVIKKTTTNNQKILDALKQEVKSRYADQPDLLEILEEGIPSVMTILNWRRKKGWEEAVWSKIRGEGLFTNTARSQLIAKLFDQAVTDGNVQAAKIWLTLSGDYSEEKNSAKTNDVADVFKSINETIHSKK